MLTSNRTSSTDDLNGPSLAVHIENEYMTWGETFIHLLQIAGVFVLLLALAWVFRKPEPPDERPPPPDDYKPPSANPYA